MPPVIIASRVGIVFENHSLDRKINQELEITVRKLETANEMLNIQYRNLEDSIHLQQSRSGTVFGGGVFVSGFNFHIHSTFCDGQGELAEYVEVALSQGFLAIGFSSHAPLPFHKSYVMPQEKLQDYCTAIKKLQTQYRDKIQICLGLEIDYLPGIIGPRSPQFAALNLDYTIGSIHLVRNGHPNGFTYTDEGGQEFEQLLDDVYGGDPAQFVKHYYFLLREMVREHRPDIIGHLDLIRKVNRNNVYFDEHEAWYKEEIMKTLLVIAKSGAVLEINTGCIARGFLTTPHPSPWIIKECYKLEIPLMLNSDAHSPKHLDTYFTEARFMLKEAGYTEQRIILNGGWVNVSLE